MSGACSSSAGRAGHSAGQCCVTPGGACAGGAQARCCATCTSDQQQGWGGVDGIGLARYGGTAYRPGNRAAGELGAGGTPLGGRSACLACRGATAWQPASAATGSAAAALGSVDRR